MKNNEKISQIIDVIKKLSAVEINELVKELELVFDVKAVNFANTLGDGGAEQKQGGKGDEEKDEVSLILKTVGASKVGVIKLVKEILGVDLMKAKKITETVPAPLKEKISRADATELSERFIAIGAETEIK